MPQWPDKEEALLNEFLRQTGYAPKDLWGYRSMLRHFQRFASRRKRPLAKPALRAWLKKSVSETSPEYCVARGVFVKRFLDWLVARGAIASHPFQELREEYECASTAAIIRALLAPDPAVALEALRPPPRYASHFGPVIRAHIERMRALGFRYSDERPFLRFDRYLMARLDAKAQPYSQLARDYIAAASSPSGRLHRLCVTRTVARALQRAGAAVVQPPPDRLLSREVERRRVRPYIYSAEEIQALLDTARRYEVARWPLRAAALHCMLTLAYCAGLRLNELVCLDLKDVNLAERTIEVRETKFFKSRRLPLSSSAMAVLRDYLHTRTESGAPTHPDARVFCHSRGGYSRVNAAALLRRVIRAAGLKPATGRRGPRIHDLRHTFVVHRMTQWYEQGINPQSRLPHLATYLGHRSIHSTLIYLTITQELLQNANGRFRAAEPDVLKAIQGGL